MSECSICGKSGCFPMGHSAQQQRDFEHVISLFEFARKLRDDVNQRLDIEALSAEQMRDFADILTERE